MIIRKSPAEIEKIAAAGAILVRTLRLLERQVRPGVSTAELDQAAERYIRSQGASRLSRATGVSRARSALPRTR